MLSPHVGIRGVQQLCLLFAWLFTVATGEFFSLATLKVDAITVSLSQQAIISRMLLWMNYGE
jgi:hypothetical protein